jgi:hypothetical protein
MYKDGQGGLSKSDVIRAILELDWDLDDGY